MSKLNKKHPEKKICKVCGLEFHNRKKWNSRGLWDKIVYCSKKCRGKSKVTNQ